MALASFFTKDVEAERVDWKAINVVILVAILFVMMHAPDLRGTYLLGEFLKFNIPRLLFNFQLNVNVIRKRWFMELPTTCDM